MYDITLRPLKDRLFDPLCIIVPSVVSPIHITAAAFSSGIFACIAASQSQTTLSVIFWLINRALDCLDGALARHRKHTSDLGGFLDLLSDFIVYSFIPVACGLTTAARDGESDNLWLAIAVLEAGFHINNFVLFYVSALIEKSKRMAAELPKVDDQERTRELTSLMMQPALVEGFESGILFTLMLAKPAWTEFWCWFMVGLVVVGICQRVTWVVMTLKSKQ